MGRLPIDYRNTLEAIKELPGSWYAAQEIPDKLIRDIGKSRDLEEWEINRLVYGTKSQIVSRHVAEVLACAANGMSAAETAKALFKSLETIKTQRRQALDVLRARNMTQAVATAIHVGILEGT